MWITWKEEARIPSTVVQNPWGYSILRKPAGCWKRGEKNPCLTAFWDRQLFEGPNAARKSSETTARCWAQSYRTTNSIVITQIQWDPGTEGKGQIAIIADKH